jgi:hypothetical protein
MVIGVLSLLGVYLPVLLLHLALPARRVEGYVTDAAGMVGSMALALALNACTDKAENAVDAAKELSRRGEAKGAAAGTLVSWHELAKFIPDKLGDFVQQGEIDGSIASVDGMQASRAVCKYETSGKTLFITITDAIGVGALREPFAKAAGLNEDSVRGYQKGKRIGAHPAIAVWQTRMSRSEVTMLVADRYVVKVDVRKATSDSEAEKLAVMLDIDGLAKLKPSAE